MVHKSCGISFRIDKMRVRREYWIFVVCFSFVSVSMFIYGNQFGEIPLDENDVNIDDSQKDFWRTEWSARCSNEARLTFLHSYCSQANTSLSNASYRLTLKRMFYDDKNKLMFCAIPKAGTTSFKKLMMQLTSPVPLKIEKGFHNLYILARFGIHPLIKVINGSERRRKLDSFHKVMVVRHPVLRLISAYKDKFYDRIYREKYNKHIIGTYRNSSVTSSIFADRPTWTEFMQFLVDHGASYVDTHWDKFLSLCQPCIHHYDSILKLETVDDDIHEFLALFRPDFKYKYDRINPSYGQRGKIIDDYLKEIPHDLWPKLADHLKQDMAAFGYGVDIENKKLTCGYSSSNLPSSINCC